MDFVVITFLLGVTWLWAVIRTGIRIEDRKVARQEAINSNWRHREFNRKNFQAHR